MTTEIVLRAAMPHWREFYSGWFMKEVAVPGHGALVIGTPGFHGMFAQNNGDFRVHIDINEAGLRNDEPAESANHRLWVIGDSMAFGWGVERDQIYTAVIARETGVPTYNVASPGADVCGYQALAARMPPSIRPRAVIVGIVLENDLDMYDCAGRAATAVTDVETDSQPHTFIEWKRKATELSATYNFLAVGLKRVVVAEEVLAWLGLSARSHQDHAAPTSEHALIVERTADELLRLSKMFPDTPFAVLVTPARRELRDNDPGYADLRRRLDGALAARGISVIDPLEDFRVAGFAPTHFAHDGHWSPLGHRLAGNAASIWVNSLGLKAAVSRAAPH